MEGPALINEVGKIERAAPTLERLFPHGDPTTGIFKACTGSELVAMLTSLVPSIDFADITALLAGTTIPIGFFAYVSNASGDTRVNFVTWALYIYAGGSRSSISSYRLLLTGERSNLVRVAGKTAHGFVAKDVLTLNGSGQFIKISDPEDDKFVALVVSVVDANNFVIALTGYVTGLSGLTTGAIHYGQSSGSISTTPSLMPVLFADSTTSGYLLTSGGSGSANIVIDETYADITALLADQADQEAGKWYMVTDASADATVDTGWAIYQKLIASTGVIGDYLKTGEQESLDVILVNASETDKGFVEEATDAEAIAGTATGGTGAKLFLTPAKLEAKRSLKRVAVTVTAGAVTLNLSSKEEIKLQTTATQTANITSITISNDTNNEVFSWSFPVTGTIVLTFPSGIVMDTTDGRWDNSAKTLTITGASAQLYLLSFSRLTSSLYNLRVSDAIYPS